MNNFETKLEELKEELFSLEEVKTYFSLKNEIENNAELTYFREQIAHFQRLMTLNIDLDEEYKMYKKEYEILLRKYQEHPLIQNFEIVKEDVYRILTEVKEIIEKYFITLFHILKWGDFFVSWNYC